ncbi:hypothetical protein [Aquimarina mytili]|uniref:Uncharacterized protein n=1 Tax=Aquimarina mytili TaxID=874423 RepID=A0A937D8A8_9FLAO|nr:hypothetical protein [Aquimarina mytili]MBL0683890.1 hypothetical protein [Aquimarina mytili]
MKNKLLNITGIVKLTKRDQASIHGSDFSVGGLNNCFRFCRNDNDCGDCGALYTCKEGMYGGICELR